MLLIPYFQLKEQNLKIFSYIACVIGLLCTIWIVATNIAEIVNRANGNYTFYSQRSTLTDGEAVLYFSSWNVLFVLLSYGTIRNLIKKKNSRSAVYSITLILLICLSFYVDTLLYHQLV
jgi:hypothetical protein